MSYIIYMNSQKSVLLWENISLQFIVLTKLTWKKNLMKKKKISKERAALVTILGRS